MRSGLPDGAKLPRRPRLSVLYWVIGGCYGDGSRTWRRWSEVVGPFAHQADAVAVQERLLAAFAHDERVHFEVLPAADG